MGNRRCVVLCRSSSSACPAGIVHYSVLYSTGICVNTRRLAVHDFLVKLLLSFISAPGCTARRQAAFSKVDASISYTHNHELTCMYRHALTPVLFANLIDQTSPTACMHVNEVSSCMTCLRPPSNDPFLFINKGPTFKVLPTCHRGRCSFGACHTTREQPAIAGTSIPSFVAMEMLNFAFEQNYS